MVNLLLLTVLYWLCRPVILTAHLMHCMLDRLISLPNKRLFYITACTVSRFATMVLLVTLNLYELKDYQTGNL